MAAEPAIGKNSLDDTKAYRDQMMGNNRPLGCLCDFVLVNYLGTSASRMQSLTCKSIEDRTTLCLQPPIQMRVKAQLELETNTGSGQS